MKVGNRTLKCKVTVKDTRKNTSNKPNRNTDENNSNDNNTETLCQHNWTKHYVEETVTVIGCQCACGEIFETNSEWQAHSVEMGLNREYGHGSVASVDIPKTITKCDYEYCEKCGQKRNVQ